MSMTTWRRELDRLRREDELIACTLTEAELDVEFDAGFGVEKGKPFTAWSEEWVYFPRCYDGAEGVARAPRNPCDHETLHVGG